VGKSGNKQIQGFNWSGLERKIKVFFIKIIFFIFEKIKKYPADDQIGFALPLSTHGLRDLENKILVEVL
jgi:hypothetical protein